MPTDPRDKRVYKAHELRHDIVHAFPDHGVPEMSVLTGPLALVPKQKAIFELVYPHRVGREQPVLNVRFIAADRLEEFGAACTDERPVPLDLTPYPTVIVVTKHALDKVAATNDRPGRWTDGWRRWLDLDESAAVPSAVEIERLKLSFKADPEEGAYLFEVGVGPREGITERLGPLVERDGQLFAYVVVYSKPQTKFGRLDDGSDAIDRLVANAVNASPKFGWLWFVHPVYFAEQLLNIALIPSVRDEIVLCEELPADLPAEDDVLVKLQWGRGLLGLRRITLDVDGDDPCLQTEPLEVVDNPVDLVKLLEPKGTP